MILRFLRSAFMGATMLCALSSPATADPISATILTWMGYSGAGGLLAPTAVLGSLLFNSFVAALPGFLLTAAISVGAGYLMQALRPRASTQATDPGARIVNLRQTVQDRSKSYGLVRLGGPVAFWKAKSGKRFSAILFNTGEIDGFEDVYLDETLVSLDGNGYVAEDTFKSDGVSMIRIGLFRGAPGQGAHPYLANEFPEWTADHKLTGIAGAVAVYQNPKVDDYGKVYPGGREPTLSTVLRGTKVFDPRDPTQILGNAGTYKYSTNAALVIADWIVSPDGFAQSVDWEEVADEADASDVLVRTRTGAWVKKWELCGTYYFASTREEVRKQLAIACDAWFYDRDDGKVGFKVGRWMEPEVTIGPEHINSIKLGEGQDGQNRSNAITIEYVEPGAGYRQFTSAPVVINDGESYQETSAQAHWVPKHTQACMIGKRTLNALRADHDATLNLNLYGLTLKNKRTFRLEYPELGISGAFETADWEFAPDGMSINVTGKATAQSHWDFDGLVDEPDPPEIVDITVTDDIEDPSDVDLSSPDAGTLYVTFNPPSRSSLLKRVRYRKVGVADWNEVGVPASQNFITINGLPPGDVYEGQVQFRTATANASDWMPETPISVAISATSTPPGPVTGASVSGAAGSATFNWTAPNSPNYVGARLFWSSVNSFPGGTPAATEYGLPNTPDSRELTGISAGTRYGWIVAINSAGDQADPVPTGSFTVS